MYVSREDLEAIEFLSDMLSSAVECTTEDCDRWHEIERKTDKLLRKIRRNLNCTPTQSKPKQL